MSLFAAAEYKASPENPSTNLSNPSQWLINLFGGGESDAGISVNEDTSLKYSAVWSAASIISTAISILPVHIIQRDERGNKTYPFHPASRLIASEPNDLMTSSTFRQTGMVHALLWGNHYVAITRNGRGEPKELALLHPAITRVRKKGSRIKYESTINDTIIEFEAADVIHVPGMSTDGLIGLSVIAHAKNAIGLGLATEKFGSKFFKNGANLGGVIEHPKMFKDEEAQAKFRRSWQSVYSGTDNALKTAVLEHGMTYKPIGIPPEDAQFLETRKFGINEIARWFSIPPHMLGDLDRATFSNIEQQSIEFVTRTLMGWIVKLEQEYARKLFTETQKRSNRWEVKFNVNALLRGDSEAQGKFIDQMIKNGVYSINDGRKYLDQNTTPGGDRHFIQRDKMPLDRYDEFVDATTKKE